MNDEIQRTPESEPTATPGTAEDWRGRLRRLVDEHPIAVLAGAAAVGAVVGIEWAAGALIGLGAGALLSGKPVHEVRDDLRRRWRRWMTVEGAGSESPGDPSS
jgi:hypothetical protein